MSDMDDKRLTPLQKEIERLIADGYSKDDIDRANRDYYRKDSFTEVDRRDIVYLQSNMIFVKGDCKVLHSLVEDLKERIKELEKKHENK